MTLAELKIQLEQNTLIDRLIVMQCDLDNYIPKQYSEKWAANRGSYINYINDIEQFMATSWMIREISTDVHLYKTNKFDRLDVMQRLISLGGIPLIVVTPSISEEILRSFPEYIINVPTLENWQIKDFIKVQCPGLLESQIDWLVGAYDGNMTGLTLDLDKIKYFPESVQKDCFEELRASNNLVEKYPYTILDFVNAIQRKDLDVIKDILPHIPPIDIEPTGLITMLYNAFKKLIKVRLCSHPTEENTGLTSKQIYAISRSPKVFSDQELIKAFKIITDVEVKLLNNQLAENQIIDYLVVKLLSL